MANSYQYGELSLKLEDTLFRAKYLIQIYALAQQVRPTTLTAAFGRDINVADVQWLIGQFEEGDFSRLPDVEIRSRLALQGLRSAYTQERNLIYLAEDFVEEADRDELLEALLQEIVSAVRSFSR